MARIQEIRQRIIDRDYYFSSHAEAEMIEDRLGRMDIEEEKEKFLLFGDHKL